ncbi:DgyrCDS13128 [Dimorphilus gyrociliatus]|uniref:RING-type E3 ubiquitin transferase n=1 Tax=Dimorphilus gyrociliatus TaxID=2664684 RepID=A0A7I8W9T8_9ANNE|nr:DgyrCDS13128 [Dimorphilus gyrociliatus]
MRFYKNGCCGKGANCFFSHDLSSKEDTVCKYYLRGSCSYGSECRFDHVKQHKTKILGPPPLPSSSEPPEKSMISGPKPYDWAQAAEFVPGAKYHGKNYAQITAVDDSAAIVSESHKEKFNELCPWAMSSDGCRLGDECQYVHGNVCEMCGYACLHPDDENQRLRHEKDCIEEHEKAMEASFAIARSKDKVCGVCMEKVLDKKPASDARFGILSHCNHVFCLSCIRRWRGQDKFEKRVVRACPECRVCSNFVTPSIIWVEDEDEKKKLMENYKNALSEKPCRYWNHGKGDCPFNEHCFYKHTDEQGNPMPPKPKPKRRVREDGETENEVHFLLWNFLETRNDNSEVLEDLLLYAGMFQDDVDTESDDFSD